MMAFLHQVIAWGFFWDRNSYLRDAGNLRRLVGANRPWKWNIPKRKALFQLPIFQGLFLLICWGCKNKSR